MREAPGTCCSEVLGCQDEKEERRSVFECETYWILECDSQETYWVTNINGHPTIMVTLTG